MGNRVVITGVGVITPIGNNKQEFWQSLISGYSGIGRITKFDVSQYAAQIAGEVKDFDPSGLINSKELRKMDGFVQYAVVAAKQAVEDAGIDFDKIEPERIGCVMGSGIGGLMTIEKQHTILLERGPKRISPFLIPMLIVNMAPGQIAINYNLKGPNFAIVTACASSNHAIGEAFRLIQAGRADIMLAGGTENCICPLGVGGFCSAKALSTRNDDPRHASRPFDKERDGFVMAEGAGILVLESFDLAKKRGAPIIAELVGYGATCDAYHMTAPDPEAKGAIASMEAALTDAGINYDEVDYINAHGTSTSLNDKVETMAIKAVFKDSSRKLAVSSIKSMTGHMLGAAGAVEAIATAISLKEGVILPTINYQYPDPDCDLDYVPNKVRKKDINVAISNGLGFGGHNATIALKKFS
ncbi:MAG: beta-ketoacyl-ACP synthase II [Candidatus Omnitrophica bacterium]|nr:beta-ketoacyl-ACP synthase II [Candidatus Omnitrophota bacterium]